MPGPPYKSCAVIVGPSGIGPRQSRELDVDLQLFVERHRDVIPVILTSCKAAPELPLFLRSFGWVDYRTLDADPLEQLVWGLVAGRPGKSPKTGNRRPTEPINR